MAQCLDCGHNFFDAGQMGDSITQGACENCGSTNYMSQPNPTQSDMEARNMPAPGEEDMGGNPLKEGFMEDGGWNNRMKRDESFASVRKRATGIDWDEQFGVHPSAPKWNPRSYRPGERDPENSPMPTGFDYEGNGDYSAQFGMSEADRNRALLLNQGLGQQDMSGTNLDRPWTQGEPGKGLIDASGQVHTWPEDFGTHERFMLSRGLRPGDVPFKFIIGPEGHVSAYNPSDPTNLVVPDHHKDQISGAGLIPEPKSLGFGNGPVDASGLDNLGLDFLASRQKLYAPWNYEASSLDLDFEQTQVIEPGPHTVEVDAGESTPLILQHDDPQLLQDAKQRLEASIKTAAPALAVPAAEAEIAAAPAEAAAIGAGAGAVGDAAAGAAGAVGDAASGAASDAAGVANEGAGILKSLWGTAKNAVGGAAGGGGAMGVLKNMGKGLAQHEAVHAVGNLMNGAMGGASAPPGPEETPSPLLSHFLFAADETYDRPGSDDKLNERADGDPEDVDGHEFKDGEDKGLFDDTNQAGGAHSPAMLDDSILERLDSLLPLLLHYYHGGEGGSDDPLIQALDGELESAHPGYKDQDSGAPHIVAFWGDLNNMLGKPQHGHEGVNDDLQKESDDPDDGDDARHASWADGFVPPRNESGPVPSAAAPGEMGAHLECPSCHGTGDGNSKFGLCQSCDGTGRAIGELMGQARGEMLPYSGPRPSEGIIQTPPGLNLGEPHFGGALPQLTQMGQPQTMTPASTPGPTPAPNMSYCPYCGSTLSPGQPQCPQCHAAVAGGTPGVAPQPRQARWTITAGPAPADPTQDPNAAAAGGDPSQMGMMAPPPPPPPGSQGNQGPQTREQFQAVAELLQSEGRGDEITNMLANPNDYADELAQVQKRDAPPQLGDDGSSSPVPAQEEAPPGDTMPMPNPADNPQPLSHVTAADNLAPKCPKCGGHTTGILDHDKGLSGCKTCGHSWQVDKKVVEAAHDDHHRPDVQPSAASWADEDGEPLQEGQEYEMYTGGYAVPDLVTIRQIKPDGVVYELMGEHGTHAVTEVTREEADLDQLTFVPAFGLDQSAPDATQDPSQNSDNTGYQGSPEQSDLSTPHMMMSNNNFMYEHTDVPEGMTLDQWRANDNPHQCAQCGNMAHHNSQLCANCEYQQGQQQQHMAGQLEQDQWLQDAHTNNRWGVASRLLQILVSQGENALEGRSLPPAALQDVQQLLQEAGGDPAAAAQIAHQRFEQEQGQHMASEVGPDWLKDELEHDQRVAGKAFTQMEQRELIDEPGEARNSDKLDLSNTHYLEEDSLLFW